MHLIKNTSRAIYPGWKPEYEQYVKVQAELLYKPHFEKTEWANPLTYQMIYEQPVVYEFKDISVSTLLIIGHGDRTIVGKNILTEEQKKYMGNTRNLARKYPMRYKAQS